MTKLRLKNEIGDRRDLFTGACFRLRKPAFPAASTTRFFRKLKWMLAVTAALMAGSSVQLQVLRGEADYGEPLRHEGASAALSIRTPLHEPTRTITMTAIHALPLEASDSLSIIAREGAAPLAISVKVHYVREPRFHTTIEYVLHRVFRDHLEELPPLPAPGENRNPIDEPRCAYGKASEALVTLPVASDCSFFTMPLTAPALSMAPVALQSQQAIGDFFVGFSPERDLRVLRGKELLGTRPGLSDHTLNNVAFTRTADGILHILATEVLISHGNSSRVHYLRFDPDGRRWLGDDVLMVRAKFTSRSTPRIASNNHDVDVFWYTDGGSTPQPEDGIYARRIGQPDTWHVIGERSEFAVLEDADGQGSTLIGAATRPSQSGIVRWFLRRDGSWWDLGATDARQTFYTMKNTGTDPFALWRGEARGTVYAAFNAIDHIVLEELHLP